MTSPWGALPTDWEHFAHVLDLREDLLPVVSNPTAQISPDSRMRGLGKTPSMYNRSGFVVGIPAWTQRQASDRDITRWSAHADYGICIQTRRVRALDIDIPDPERAAAVRFAFEQWLGVLPVRRRANSGKCVLALRVVGGDDDLVKRVVNTAHGAIELLGSGQQFVAVGMHTDGVRYEWEGGLPRHIPEVSRAELDAAWSAIGEAFGLSTHVARRGVVPVVPRTATDAHPDHVVAFLEANGWVREWDRSGRVDITCPWSDQHSADTGPSATSYFPAGVGGFQQGHFRCLHAHCTGRSDGEFLRSLGYEKAQFEPVLSGARDADAGDVIENGTSENPWPAFARLKDGGIDSTATNAGAALARPDIVGYRLGWDDFLGRRVIAASGAGTWRAFRDADYFELRVQLERRGFRKPGHDLVREAVRSVSETNAFDSAIDWARSLQWDGQPRMATFFSRYVGCPDTPYTRAVGLYLWTAMAGRCLVPGVQADMVPVMISREGTGKTSLVKALAPTPEAFLEVNLQHRNEEATARALRGKLVGEIAELRGLLTRDADDIKAWVTRTHEEIRHLYAEYHIKYPRRLVMIGTGNTTECLTEESVRRWLPMQVGRTDLDALARDRDQLWAEGIAAFDARGVDWQDAQALAVDEQVDFRADDTWRHDIVEWLSRTDMDEEEGGGQCRGARAMTMRDVLVGALRMNSREIARPDEVRAGRILRSLGYEKGNRRVAGHQQKVWIPTDSCLFVKDCKNA